MSEHNSNGQGNPPTIGEMFISYSSFLIKSTIFLSVYFASAHYLLQGSVKNTFVVGSNVLLNILLLALSGAVSMAIARKVSKQLKEKMRLATLKNQAKIKELKEIEQVKKQMEQDKVNVPKYPKKKV